MDLLFYVYILASAPWENLYTGHTDNLQKRIAEHRNGTYDNTHSKKYNVHDLVYYETFNTRDEAKRREAIIKKFSRTRKFALIEKDNPRWEDLASNWTV